MDEPGREDGDRLLAGLDEDEELLAELGEAIRAQQQVPDSFRQAGRTAFAHFGLDAELARLLSDSATEPAGELASSGMRSAATAVRTLTFATATLTVEIEIHPDAVRGQVAPALDGTVELRGAGLSGEFPVEDGWFVVRPVPTAPFRLSLRLGDGLTTRAALTDWIAP